jgi:hypothetical protein
MISLRRFDSRATIWVRRRRVSAGVPATVNASTAPVSDASGLRISWAMLAAMRPSVARRSAWRIRVSSARRVERSSQAMMSPSRVPSPATSADPVTRKGATPPSGRDNSIS